MSNLVKDIEELMVANKLFKAIRGQEFVFRTPTEINADMLPTDHNELLAKGVYPRCSKLGDDRVSYFLENALKEASSDALGVYCSIQCYYIQIISERENDSPFKIDRIDLPLYLGKQFKAYERELSALRLNSYDPDEAPLCLTIAAMNALQRNENIKFS